MKINYKKVLLIGAIIIIILSYYFYTHFPIGTFDYTNAKNKNFKIRIKVTQQLGTFLEPVYNMSVSIKNRNYNFSKEFKTCDYNLNILVLRKENKEFVVLDNLWSGFCKCDSKLCGDFFYLGDGGYSIDTLTNQKKYITNYQDSIAGDTINFVRFEELIFKNIR